MQIEYSAEQLELQGKLAEANINPASFLATDYLNHFNEIVMLLEMVPDMPELAEDAYDWQPKGYSQHFSDSGFAAKALAIEAFENAPSMIRNSFDQVCADLDTLILKTLEALKLVNATERGFSPAAQEFIRNQIQAIQDMLLVMNQIIHGKLDESVPGVEVSQTPAEDEDVQSQADIDKLFD
jgi:hypothetical protein